MSRDPKSNYYDAGGIETLDVIKAKLTVYAVELENARDEK